MPVTLICQQCSTPFRVGNDLKDKARFCSRECKNQSQRMSQETRACGYCGKEFVLRPLSQIRERQLYCSRECGRAVGNAKRKGKGLRTFWQKVGQCEHGYDCPFCCWPFKGGLNSNGYGRVKIGDGTYRGANRVAWELHNERDLPDDLFAAHYCHFPACSNFDHIHAATQKENMADSVRDRRHYYGERHHNSKMTKEPIKEAFALRAQGWGYRRLAKRFSVSYIAMHKLLNHETWKYVDLDTP